MLNHAFLFIQTTPKEITTFTKLLNKECNYLANLIGEQMHIK